MSVQVQEEGCNWSLENVFWRSLKRNPVSSVDKRKTPHKRGPHTYSRVSWPKYVGSSSLHLPVLDVKTAWNRGGHSDRLLWGSLVNSYWTPPPPSPYPARPPTILPREQALMASFIPSLWRELMCGVLPPFPYQPPIGIPLWSAVSPPTPTIRPNFHLNMERSLDFDTS